MLAIIDASGGNATVAANSVLLSLNHLRAIRAVATAAAGSTPSANAVTQANTMTQVGFTVPGTTIFAYSNATVIGSALSAISPNVLGFASNGTSIGVINTLLSGTITTATGITSLAIMNAASISISTISGNTTGGLQFSSAQTCIVNGQLIYISNNAASPTGITNFTNGYYMVQNTASNTTFRIFQPNGAPVITSGSGSAVTGLDFRYAYLVTTANSGPVLPGMGIATASGALVQPPVALMSQYAGSAGAGSFVLSWPGPFASAIATGTATLGANLNSTVTASYYGTVIYGTANSITGLAALNTVGTLTTGTTSHGLVVGQMVVIANTAATVTGIGLPTGNCFSYYVTDVVNATAFTVSATIGGAAATTIIANAAVGTMLIPFPGPVTAIAYGNNMISCIANTEGGGWLSDIHNSTTDFSIGVASISSNIVSFNNIPLTTVTGIGNKSLVLDLYNTATNKALYPYHKITMIPEPYSNVASVGSNCMLVYHGAAAGQGFSNATPGTTLTFSGSATASVNAGLTNPTGPSAMVNQRTTYVTATPFNWQLGDFVYTIACNSQYMHIIANNFLMSMGLRNNQGWEDIYADNPYVYNFSVDTRTPVSSAFYPSASFAWMRSISNTGGINSANNWQTRQLGVVAVANVNPVTGQAMTTVATAPQFFDATNLRNQGPQGGLFQLNSHANTTFPLGYAPAFDSTTNTFVPPAYPIVVQLNKPGFYNAGGSVKGLYKSMSNANNGTLSFTAMFGNYYVANGTYTVDGDPYIAVLNGPNTATISSTDMFLIRKA